MGVMFDYRFKEYFEEQYRKASERRREMLKKDLTGEIRLLRDVLWPVFGSFDGLEMEHEMISSTGTRIFGDFYYRPINGVLETEGFVSHAEKITRDRFDFEKMRIRTFAEYAYPFIPFSWDDIVKRPDACRRSLYAILGKYGSLGSRTAFELSVYEREVVRYALRLDRSFGWSDICHCLQVGRTKGLKVLRSLLDKGLISPAMEGRVRIHAYRLEDKARLLVL
jgi:hypothetical protein